MKKYLCVKGKVIKCTEDGFRLLNNILDIMKNPVLTAIFESNLNQIEKGSLSLDRFLAKQVITLVVKQVGKSKTMTVS